MNIKDDFNNFNEYGKSFTFLPKMIDEYEISYEGINAFNNYVTKKSKEDVKKNKMRVKVKSNKKLKK